MLKHMKLILFLTAAVFAAGSLSAKTKLIFSSWGGAYEMSQTRAYAEPFIKKNPDVEIIWEAKSNEALANLRAQVEADNVIWDLVDVIPDDAEIACAEGLLERPDWDSILAKAPDGTSAKKDFVDGGVTDCFVAQIVYSNIVAYNTEVFKEKSLDIKAVFDLKKYPGKRSLQRTPINNLEWALAADGVPANKIYDVLATDKGVKRAFAKLDTIKDQVIWWEKGAQPPQLLADKEVVFASAYNGRIFDAQVNEKQPFQIIWDAQVFELDGWVVPKGKLSKTVKDFLTFATDTQRLADQAKFISYGPARKSSGAKVSKHADTGVDMKPHMPTYGPNFKNPIKKDIEFWADYKDELVEKFNAWLAQ